MGTVVLSGDIDHGKLRLICDKTHKSEDPARGESFRVSAIVFGLLPPFSALATGYCRKRKLPDRFVLALMLGYQARVAGGGEQTDHSQLQNNDMRH